jgi:hypothetical protein
MLFPKLGGTYGRTFEAYLHDCVQRAGFAPDSYVNSPKFSDGAEICDGLFIDGLRIILCEYKSSVLTAEAKLSGRLDLLEPDLRKKFVTGDAEGRKGIAQLSRSIDRLITGEPVTGLPSRNWSLLQPVMSWHVLAFERSVRPDDAEQAITHQGRASDLDRYRAFRGICYPI